MRRHLLLVALLASSAPARADGTPSLALLPAPAGEPTLLVEPAAVRGDAHVRARALGVFASQPLVLQNAEQEHDPVVDRQLWLHALASVSLKHRYQLSLDAPLLLSEATGTPPPHGDTAARPDEQARVGDVRASARARLLGEAGPGQHVGVAASLALPTGRGYAGDGALGVRALAVADGQSTRAFWALNAGYRHRPGARLPGVVPTRVGSEVVMALAYATFVDGRRSVALGSELEAAFTVGEGARLLDPRATRAHFLIQARVRPVEELELGAGFGPDVGQAAGAADFRALGFVGVTPEVAPPPPDRDDDHVPDRVDACLDLPGVPSRDPLMHGCPEVPPDFDADEIPDPFDACPRAAGVPTGDRRTHGCPPAVDGDGDGIVDREDACPTVKGVRSAARERHGCPPPPPAARVEAEQVVISEQVQFEHGTAVLRPESDGVLGAVARVLGEHPEILRVEVAGHTDDTGTPAVNQKLSEERAASVVKWLVDHGVDAARLTAKGYGQSAPIADNATEEGRARNRRVEFRILQRAPGEAAP